MGRGLFSFLTLPWNLTFETVPGVYTNSFGYQIGPLYLIGILTIFLRRKTRETPIIAFFLKFILVYTVIWFFTFQEARYILPIFPLIAVIGGAAMQSVFSFENPLRWVAPTIVILALFYCQAHGFSTLLQRYGYAVGNIQIVYSNPPIEAAAALKKVMTPDERVLLFYESRSYIFRGLDYIPFQPNEGAPLLHTIRKYNDSQALHCMINNLGVSHVLVNTTNINRILPVFVPGYGPKDYQSDLYLFFSFIEKRTTKIYDNHGISIFKLHQVSDCIERQ